MIIHYPTLRTVLMIEKILEEADEPISRNEIKRRLPVSIMHQTLALILEYLDASGKIAEGSKGISWIYNDNPKFLKLIKRAVTIK